MWSKINKAGDIMGFIVCAGRFPVWRGWGQAGFNWVLVDVFHHITVFLLVFYCSGKKTLAPNMVNGAMYTVPTPGGTCLNPLKYSV